MSGWMDELKEEMSG